MDRIIGIILGLGTVFLVLSIFASHLQEMLSAYIAKRASMLEDAVECMVSDPDILKDFFKHPLIQSIAMSNPRPSLVAGKREVSRPTYIPAQTFSQVLQSVLAVRYAPESTSLAEIVAKMPPSDLKTTLSTVFTGIADAPAAAAQWYNDTMDRLRGRYKRKTQLWLFVWGLGLAIFINANVFRITSTLWTSADARDGMSLLAQQYTQSASCKQILKKSQPDQKNANSTPSPNPGDTGEASGKKGNTATGISANGQGNSDNEQRSAGNGQGNKSGEQPGNGNSESEGAATGGELPCGAPGIKELYQQLAPVPIGWSQEDIHGIWPWGGDKAAQQGTDAVTSNGASQGSVTPPIASPPAKPDANSNDKLKSAIITLFVDLFGWVLTAVAVSFGAPFWFDFINQFINLRLSGPAPAKQDHEVRLPLPPK